LALLLDGDVFEGSDELFLHELAEFAVVDSTVAHCNSQSEEQLDVTLVYDVVKEDSDDSNEFLFCAYVLVRHVVDSERGFCRDAMECLKLVVHVVEQVLDSTELAFLDKPGRPELVIKHLLHLRLGLLILLVLDHSKEIQELIERDSARVISVETLHDFE